MIFRISCVGLVTLAVTFAQGPAGGPAGRRGFGHGGPGPFAGGRVLGAEMGRPGRVVKSAPFSADLITERTQTLANGDHIKQSMTSHFSRDSEGRTRREQSLNGLSALTGDAAGAQNVVFIADPVAGTSYVLNPANKSATKSPLGRFRVGGGGSTSNGNESGSASPQMARPNRGGGRGPANDPNVKTESLGTQTIEGVSAQGTRTTVTIPAGRMGNDQPIPIVTEHWFSSELQIMVLEKRSDPRNGETVTRYTNISRAEPVPTSFQVPGDYQIRTGRGAAAQQ
jgi:hypothetical protein